MNDHKKRIRQFMEGDLQAFRDIVECLEGECCRSAYLWTRDGGIAQDVVQEAFIKAWQHRSSLSDPGRFRGWFYQILYRQFLDWKRRRTNSERPVGDVTDSTVEPRNHSGRLLFSSAFPSPVDELIHNERSSELVQVLNHLPDQDQELMALRYGSELSIREVAQVLGLKPSAVQSRIYRVLRRLEQQLSE